METVELSMILRSLYVSHQKAADFSQIATVGGLFCIRFVPKFLSVAYLTDKSMFVLL